MPNDPRTPLPSGARVENVELLDCVGRGGLSLVYLAHHPQAGEVVVKEFCPVGSLRGLDGRVLLPPRSEHIREDFAREAYNLDALKRCSGPSQPWRVPLLLSRCEANGTAYLVLERISGTGIEQRSIVMRRGGPEEFAGWVQATMDILLQGLEAFEAAGLCHGDVTPDNLIIADDGRPTFIDFGSTFHRKDYRTQAGPAHPSFRPPRELMDAVVEGPWIDVYGLCATFHYLITRRMFRETEVVQRRSGWEMPDGDVVGPLLQILASIQQGLDPGEGLPIGARAIRRTLAAQSDPTSEPIGGTPGDTASQQTITRKRDMASHGTARNQTCLLQSFDTPRFRSDDGQWLRQTNGQPLLTSLEQKVALARAEALLAVCFGREIVVPAGQVADSLGFEKVFREINAAYAPRRGAIRAACKRVRMPDWRPFRLGLERPELRDYVGFTQSYRYTGADMVLLAINDESVDREKATAAFFERAVQLFGQGKFAALGDLMLKNAGREDFEPFARDLHAYFDPGASVFADRTVPEVSATEYASLFRSRLEDAELSGRGLELARESLGIVKRIEADLAQHALQGFRGNWYVYRKKFAETWPLARAYLDHRLFINLSRLYDVDHPIFVSQAFEYGVFDHSLFLGPKFGASSSENPEREVDLLKLAACTTEGINWDAVLELYLDDEFLRSVKLMNRSFFSSDPDELADYPHMLRAHAALLARKTSAFLRIDASSGAVSAKRDHGATDVMIEAVDSMTHRDAHKEGARTSLASVSFGTGARAGGGALVAIAPIGRDGQFNLQDHMADQMLNYYIKPYRMLINRDA